MRALQTVIHTLAMPWREIQTRRRVRALARQLGEKNEWERSRAAEQLDATPHASVVSALKNAARSFERRTDAHFLALLLLSKRQFTRKANFFAAMTRRSPRLQNPQPRVERLAIDVFSELPAPKAIPLLKRTLDVYSDVTRHKTIAALAATNHADAIPLLYSLLTDSSTYIQREALYALCQLCAAHRAHPIRQANAGFHHLALVEPFFARRPHEGIVEDPRVIRAVYTRASRTDTHRVTPINARLYLQQVRDALNSGHAKTPN